MEGVEDPERRWRVVPVMGRSDQVNSQGDIFGEIGMEWGALALLNSYVCLKSHQTKPDHKA